MKLLMTVDIGDGRIDTIKIYENDNNFEQLARNFQRKHRLGEQVIVPLTEHIRSNVEALENEKKSPRPSVSGSQSARGKLSRSIGSTPGKVSENKG